MNFRLITFMLTLGLLLQPTVAQDFSRSETADPVKGRKLFEREWNSGLFTRAKGLGPLFNADSCVACHRQGGAGGAGPVSHNAHLLSILPARDKNGGFDLSERSLERMFEVAAEIHQDLNASNGIVLHRFSAVDEYQSWRDQLIWGDAKTELMDKRNKILTNKPIHRILKQIPAERSRRSRERKSATEVTIQVSQRNTPSLFGVGLIEQIPDEAILAIAQQQRGLDNDGIEGEIARLPDNTIGKFGWRGQKSSLTEFTIQACAVELGLNTENQSESNLPVSLIAATISLPARGNEIDQQEVTDLVAFVRQLPAPYENLPSDTKQLEFVARGEVVFARLQCATCHVKKVGDVDGVYSDFLMHDMGSQLADVAGVISTQEGASTQSIGGYFGPSESVKSNSTRTITVGTDTFWQTPPLWGVANSAPYMHDGRASDFREAILLHGGEAEKSRNAYKRLTPKYRKFLHAYLNSLGVVKQLSD